MSFLKFVFPLYFKTSWLCDFLRIRWSVASTLWMCIYVWEFPGNFYSFSVCPVMFNRQCTHLILCMFLFVFIWLFLVNLLWLFPSGCLSLCGFCSPTCCVKPTRAGCLIYQFHRCTEGECHLQSLLTLWLTAFKQCLELGVILLYPQLIHSLTNIFIVYSAFLCVQGWDLWTWSFTVLPERDT